MIPDRSTFESAYAGQAPWDIGRPNKVLVDVADRMTGTGERMARRRGSS
ncbi:MAG TPA: hypothetical protein VMG10_05150 [Gemmataceae bacterium]|nr:hypothetical protein [Gemmataceae bacterium]